MSVEESRFVEVGGRRIHHRVVGDHGDAVVMVHGFGGSLETWAENQATLAAGGRTVAALDLPGHGESSLDVGSGSLDELVACVEGYLDAAGFGRAHLVGHSMGAAVCLALTDRSPSRVRSLTLVGPAGLGQKIDPDFIRGFITARGRDELLPYLRRQYVEPGLASDDQLERVVAHKQRSGAVEAMVKIASSRYGGTPSGKSLREIAGTVPTLVVWGARDAIIPPPAPGDLAQSGVIVHVLPDCGHLVQVEGAAAFNRVVDAFLREVVRAG